MDINLGSEHGELFLPLKDFDSSEVLGLDFGANWSEVHLGGRDDGNVKDFSSLRKSG